jgi:uncharacterized protein (TIGR00299 family) protein
VTKIAYLDCFSGAAGDMILGSLLDAGYPLEDLRRGLAALKVEGYELTLAPVRQHGITGSKFDVIDHAQEQPVRNLSLVGEILQNTDLPADVIEKSLRVFTRLGEAEAKVHGVTLDEVHFHEVGAVDALVDIVGTCLALHDLGIERVYASALPLGSGTVRTDHGLLPVPAPATLALLTAAGAPTIPSDARGELVTPTGAALLTTLATFERPAMCVQQVGYGFGSRVMPWANMLRVWIGEAVAHVPPAAHAQVHPSPHGHPHDHGHSHPHPHHHGPDSEGEQE